jgi:predicted hydrolase (HD superfamily)
MLSKAEALALIATTSRSSHAILVGSLMRRLAQRIDMDEDKWELVGLLHDLDYDQTRNDRSQHGIVTSEQLRGQLDEESLHAIQSHDHRTGVKPRSTLAIALKVADATSHLSGKTEKHLNAEMLSAEIDKIATTQPWIRRSMRRCEEIGIDFEELLTIALEVARNL